MIFGRYPIARLAFGINRVAEVYSLSLPVSFSEADALNAAARLDAATGVHFSETETLSAAGRLDAVTAAAFAETETFDVETDVVIDKFLRLINAPTARRVYLMEMTIRPFR
jgi:hypothetical protein